MPLNARSTSTSLRRRVIELAYRHNLGHVSSALTTCDVLGEILQTIGERDIIILSSGHAALALYAANESRFGIPAESYIESAPVHPSLDKARHIHCTTGSLGQGITVAVGYALADPSRTVHCIISDGECSEGAVWESLAFIESAGLENIVVHVNANGLRALGEVNVGRLEQKLKAFLPSIQIHRTVTSVEGMEGVAGHYKRLTAEQYAQAIR